MTTLGSVLQSAEGLAEARQVQMVAARFSGGLLLGMNEQINCTACVSGFGSVGSMAAGAHGRYPLSERLTVLGGFSVGQSAEHGVVVKSSPVFALALRYDFVDWGPSRPFGEIGGYVAPLDELRFTRVYANGAGLARGIGDTSGQSAAAFVRFGWLFRVSPINEFAVSGEVGRAAQRVRGYSEPLTQTNPFEATVRTGTDLMNYVKIGAQFTHLFGERIEVNVNGGVVRSFGTKDGLKLSVDGFGVLAPPPLKDLTWLEYGGRIGVRFSPHSILDVFLDATTGQKPLGSLIHGGVGLRYAF